MTEPCEEVKRVEQRYEKALDDMEKHYKDVLDKIRDEIKAEMDDIASGCVAKYSHDEGYYSGLSWVLKIIDKYKAQTE